MAERDIIKNKTVRFPASEGKRVFARATLTGRVLIHDDNRLFIAPLANLSSGGIFVSQLVGLSQGAHVRVVIKSPRLGAPVQAVGRVVRVETGPRKGLAVAFESIDPVFRQTIQKCVTEDQVARALKARP